MTDEEKAKIAEAAAKKAERAAARQVGGGLNPFAVLVMLLAISMGEKRIQQSVMCARKSEREQLVLALRAIHSASVDYGSC